MVFRLMWMLAFLSATAAWAWAAPSRPAADHRPRLLVLTDIGGDPDDTQSLVRLMVFSNEFEIEGLIASASGTPGELKKAITQPELIRQIVRAYGQVLPTLRLHAGGYADAEALLACVKSGNPHRGWKNVGEGGQTEGSQWIVRAGDRDDPRPLNIAVWGGQTDLAQALWRVRADRGDQGLRAFLSRVRIYDISDQDGIFAQMQKAYAGLNYVLAKAPPTADRRQGAYRGMYLGGAEELTSLDWLDRHVRNGHGPLGALYPPKTWTAPNPHSALKEGDTPSWFFFLPLSPGDPSHPDWGGWGGRFCRGPDGVWRDAPDTVGGVTDARAAVWRWRTAFQNHFQARMDWCVQPADRANHAPQAVLNGQAGAGPVELSLPAGQAVTLSAKGSADPDAGQTLSYRWWVYAEAGTYDGKYEIRGADEIEARLTALGPVSAGKTLHVILEVRDDGEPPLTTFRRAVVRLAPPGGG